MNDFSYEVTVFKRKRCAEFRKSNPEYKDLPDGEIEKMYPLSPEELLALKERYAAKLEEAIAELKAEIESDEALLRDGMSQNYQYITELRNDLISEKRTLVSYEAELKKIKDELEASRNGASRC